MSRFTPEEQEKAKKAAELEKRDDDLDLLAVLNTPQGFRFIKGLLSKSYVFNEISIYNSEIYARAKIRDFFLPLVRDIKRLAPELLVGMIEDV